LSRCNPRSISIHIAATDHTDTSDTEQSTAEKQAGDERQNGPVVIAVDGSPAAEHALGAAGHLLAERRALVLVVWKAGLGFELLEMPAVTGLPPAPIDIRTAMEIDEAQYEGAQRVARRAAGIAREAGSEALVVAEAPEIPISDTIVRVARERGSPAVVVGERAHGRLGEVFLGSISRDVIRYASCPVIVVRHAEARGANVHKFHTRRRLAARRTAVASGTIGLRSGLDENSGRYVLAGSDCRPWRRDPLGAPALWLCSSLDLER
jgi:nucleotide-binding universal stress UspA family protein